jgi:phosphate transport system permease protein
MSKNIGDKIFKGLAIFASLLLISLVISLFLSLVIYSIPSIKKFGFKFLIDKIWDPVADKYGALPAIYGTLVTSFLALLIAFPISIGIAIFISELAPIFLKRLFSFIIELLGAIPSLIYGMWGLFVLAPLVQLKIGPFIQKILGFLPFFQGYPMGVGYLTAGIVLSIMIIPTISSLSREILMAVPIDQREAGYALGMTKWEVISKVVLGNARSGIFAAGILGLGRALGEAVAVTMVIGNFHDISISLFSPGVTITSVIINQFAEATGELKLSVLMELALILFLITFLIMGFARYYILKRIVKE